MGFAAHGRQSMRCARCACFACCPAEKPKLSPTNTRALTRMKQTLRKHNVNYAEQVRAPMCMLRLLRPCSTTRLSLVHVPAACMRRNAHAGMGATRAAATSHVGAALSRLGPTNSNARGRVAMR